MIIRVSVRSRVSKIVSTIKKHASQCITQLFDLYTEYTVKFKPVSPGLLRSATLHTRRKEWYEINNKWKNVCSLYHTPFQIPAEIRRRDHTRKRKLFNEPISDWNWWPGPWIMLIALCVNVYCWYSSTELIFRYPVKVSEFESQFLSIKSQRLSFDRLFLFEFG